MTLVPRGMAGRIAALAAAVLTATVAGYGWLLAHNQAGVLRETARRSGTVLGRNLAESCSHGLIMADYAGLEVFLLRAADLPDVLEIQLAEPDGTLLVDVAAGGDAPPRSLSRAKKLALPARPGASLEELPDRLVVWQPVTAGSLLGWVRVTLSLRAVADLQAAAWRYGLLLALLCAAGGSAVLLVSMRPSLRTIGDLASFARRLHAAKGEQIPVPRGPVELALLGESLNHASRELKVAEQRLVEERERLAVTLRSIGDGVIATDVEGGIILMNSAAERLTGWSQAEVFGRPLAEVLRVHDSASGEPAADPVRRIIEGRAALAPTGRTVLVSRQGVERSVADSGAPIIDDAGALVGVVLVCRDVSEIVRMEEERGKLEAQLRQSQKMEAVGQLAGGIAHDFNNILSAIIGFGSLLQMKIAEGDPRRQNLDAILDAASRAAQLTRSLLTLSRRQVMELKSVDLNAVVCGIEPILRRLIRENVEFRTRPAPGDLTVTADPGQLEQVLMNLVTNARDAMPQGGTLTIGTEAQELAQPPSGLAPGSYAVLAISDTGIGMDATTRERLFEPFFTTKEVGKGTGLGLAVVYGIVKQHGGSVNVYSEPGHGTTFRIYLPRHAGGTAERAPEAAPAPVGGRETVLLVEDDAAVRKVIGIILEEHGYRVFAVEDGAEALAFFQERGGEIDLVLTDVIMPGKDGRVLAAEMRLLRRQVRVLFMSGYTAEVIDQQHLLEEGEHFVSKPLSPATLLTKIREVLASPVPGGR